MSRQRAGYLIAISFALIVFCAGGSFVLSIIRVVRDLPVHWAAAQGDIFEDMRVKSLDTIDPAKIVGYLEYAESYYVSGSKHAKGSPLDRIVEGYRAATIREIIGRLRVITTEDLGDDPQNWINKYGKRR